MPRKKDEVKSKVKAKTLRSNPYGLTVRELVVLRLVAEGDTDREIADELCIKPHTASKHVKNIRRKMNAKSRTNAGVRAVREKLID